MKADVIESPVFWKDSAVPAAEITAAEEHPMEHRWGWRRPCRARVLVSARGGISGIGRLRNVSMSGAFLETSLRLPLLAELAVVVLRDDESPHRLEFTAVVARQDAGGAGIEWCDPNPGSICRQLGCGMDCAGSKFEPA